MTEINDHLKLLFARAGEALLPRLRAAVRRDTPESIYAEMSRVAQRRGDPRLVITFPWTCRRISPRRKSPSSSQRQGYTRIHDREGTRLEVVQDRVSHGQRREGARGRGDRGRAAVGTAGECVRCDSGIACGRAPHDGRQRPE
jgi:excinuclease ABC subunit A